MKKKIKVDVITLHAVQNYGSVLQALATQEILKQHGCDVTIIDYVREDVRYENLVKNGVVEIQLKHSRLSRQFSDGKTYFGLLRKSILT